MGRLRNAENPGDTAICFITLSDFYSATIFTAGSECHAIDQSTIPWIQLLHADWALLRAASEAGRCNLWSRAVGSFAGDHDAGTPSSRKDSETSNSSALTSHYVRLSTIHPIHGDLFSHHSIDRESRTEDAYAFSELDGCGQS